MTHPRTDIEKLFYKAIRELRYLQELVLEEDDDIRIQDIIERGMKLLGIRDLSAERLEEN